MKTGSKVLTAFIIIVFLLAGSIGFFMRSGGISDYGDIAVVNVSGVIYESRPVVEILRRYEKQDGVRAIVVRIDSPGGGVAASQEIYEELSRIRRESNKPLVASLGGVAASGGYYVACGADEIIANPGTLLGSIGAVISTVNMEELFEKIGLKYKIIKSGHFKDTGSSVRELTEEEAALLQELVDNIHRQFLNVVKERRQVRENQVEKIGDSRIFTGEQALELNLVDRMGTFYDAVEAAAGLAGLEEWDLIEERKRRTLRELIFGLMPAGSGELFIPLYMMQKGQ
jgi:protease IV